MPSMPRQHPTIDQTGSCNEDGCAFIVGDFRPRAALDAACGAPRRANSPYCSLHHALCHVDVGSRAERRRLREIEALAKAVGGRYCRPSDLPTDRVLRLLERAARHFL
jgi:hypothetical protein